MIYCNSKTQKGLQRCNRWEARPKINTFPDMAQRELPVPKVQQLFPIARRSSLCLPPPPANDFTIPCATLHSSRDSMERGGRHRILAATMLHMSDISPSAADRLLIEPIIPLWDDAHVLYGTYATQDICPRSCTWYGPQAKIGGRSHKSGIASVLKDRDHEAGIDYLLKALNLAMFVIRQCAAWMSFDRDH